MSYRDMLLGLGPEPIALGAKMTKVEAEVASRFNYDCTPLHEEFANLLAGNVTEIDAATADFVTFGSAITRVADDGTITRVEPRDGYYWFADPITVDGITIPAGERVLFKGFDEAPLTYLGWGHHNLGPATISASSVNAHVVNVTYADDYGVALGSGMRALLPGGDILSVSLAGELSIQYGGRGKLFPTGTLRDHFDGRELVYTSKDNLRWNIIRTAKQRRAAEKAAGTVSSSPSPDLSRKPLASVSRDKDESKASPAPSQALEKTREDMIWNEIPMGNGYKTVVVWNDQGEKIASFTGVPDDCAYAVTTDRDSAGKIKRVNLRYL